jgi:C4-dicarboxylate transporter, DctM subunit
VLYAMSSIARVPLLVLARELVPFIAAIALVLVAITVVPGLVTWLPTLVMGGAR